jgi:hypothetical protein
MDFSRRRLKTLINEIRQEDISLDAVDVAILNRWCGDDRAMDALRDILARAEKTSEIISDSDVAAFIQFVLTIKSYAQKTDSASAEIVRLRRELKRHLPKERTLLMRAIRKPRISYEARKEAIMRMTELDQMDSMSQAQPPVRSNKNGSRTRTLFMKELSAAVREDANLWMDDQVAAIASMVLECDIDSDQVRNTRRR